MKKFIFIIFLYFIIVNNHVHAEDLGKKEYAFGDSYKEAFKRQKAVNYVNNEYENYIGDVAEKTYENYKEQSSQEWDAPFSDAVSN